MGLFSAFKQRNFWINLGIAAAVLLVLVVLVFKSFSWFTNHGETIQVPDLMGMDSKKATETLAELDMELVVNDTLYEVDQALKDIPFGGVIDQNPKAGEEVKSGRKIYVSLRSDKAPMVDMPNLIDLSLRQAINMLESRGLKFGKTITKPGLPPVMQQLYKNKPIQPGTKIAKGSVVDLVVGSGQSDVDVTVPTVVGMTRKEALSTIAASNLSVGAEIFPAGIRDSNAVKVVRQSPVAVEGELIPSGSDVDLWYGL